MNKQILTTVAVSLATMTIYGFFIQPMIVAKQDSTVAEDNSITSFFKNLIG